MGCCFGTEKKEDGRAELVQKESGDTQLVKTKNKSSNEKKSQKNSPKKKSSDAEKVQSDEKKGKSSDGASKPENNQNEVVGGREGGAEEKSQSSSIALSKNNGNGSKQNSKSERSGGNPEEKYNDAGEDKKKKSGQASIFILDPPTTKAALQAETIQELFSILSIDKKYVINFTQQNIKVSELTNVNEVDLFNLLPDRDQREALQTYIKAVFYAEARAVQKYNEEQRMKQLQLQQQMYENGGVYMMDEYHDPYRDDGRDDLLLEGSDESSDDYPQHHINQRIDAQRNFGENHRDQLKIDVTNSRQRAESVENSDYDSDG